MAKRGAKSQGEGLSEEEVAAMKEALSERKAGKANGEGAVLAKIAEMKEPDRGIATRVHAIVKKAAPALTPRTWYGMPAYADGDRIICFFQPAGKFKARYSTLGFSDRAALDDGEMWPTSFALKALTPAGEARISALVKKAVG